MNTLQPDWLHWPQTQMLITAFAAHPTSLRFVGGAVRDALLKRSVQDVDAATSLLPDDVIKLLEQSSIRAIPTGIAHGTVTALIDGKSFEITTLRRDVATDGRHAEVAFTHDWQQDASRRDFTMNALYLTPGGELFDYFSGMEDAKAGCVRFIGDPAKRIEEDYLRILRYFRFLAQMGCPQFDGTIKGPIYPPELHLPSYGACEELAEGIEQLSGERIHREMFKLLALPELTDSIFMWMSESGVMQHIFPDLIPSYCETLIPLEREFSLVPDPMRRLCMCLSDDEFVPLERQFGMLCNRWKLSNEETRRLSLFQKHCYGIEADTSLAEVRRLKRTVGEVILTDLVAVTWAAYAANGHGKEKSRAAFAPMLDIAQHWPVPEFPVTGQDLLDRGMKPGKAVGKALKEMGRVWEKSDYQMTREELLRGLLGSPPILS